MSKTKIPAKLDDFPEEVARVRECEEKVRKTELGGLRAHRALGAAYRGFKAVANGNFDKLCKQLGYSHTWRVKCMKIDEFWSDLEVALKEQPQMTLGRLIELAEELHKAKKPKKTAKRSAAAEDGAEAGEGEASRGNEMAARPSKSKEQLQSLLAAAEARATSLQQKLEMKDVEIASLKAQLAAARHEDVKVLHPVPPMPMLSAPPQGALQHA